MGNVSKQSYVLGGSGFMTALSYFAPEMLEQYSICGLYFFGTMLMASAVLSVKDFFLRPRIEKSLSTKKIPLIDILRAMKKAGWDMEHPTYTEIDVACNVLRQAGLDGDIEFYGRKITGNLYEESPLQKIPQAHWREHGINNISCVDENKKDRMRYDIADKNCNTFTATGPTASAGRGFADIHTAPFDLKKWIKGPANDYRRKKRSENDMLQSVIRLRDRKREESRWPNRIKKMIKGGMKS